LALGCGLQSVPAVAWMCLGAPASVMAQGSWVYQRHRQLRLKPMSLPRRLLWLASSL